MHYMWVMQDFVRSKYDFARSGLHDHSWRLDKGLKVALSLRAQIHKCLSICTIGTGTAQLM